MAATNVDAGVQTVIDLMQTIVASEGGSLELVELREGKLTVRYEEGVNEECPECVPDHAMLQQLMVASLNVHAPHIQVEVV